MKRIVICLICLTCVLLIACNDRPLSVNGTSSMTGEEEIQKKETVSETGGEVNEKETKQKETKQKKAKQKKAKQESKAGIKEENPIDTDEYFAALFDPESDISEAEHRGLMLQYGKAWEEEYKNVIQWLLKKCKYEEDRNDILKYDQSVRDCIEENSDSVLETMILENYEYKPGSFERGPGNSTWPRIRYQQGKMYRGICLSLIETMSHHSEKYTFLKRDYSEISVG